MAAQTVWKLSFGEIKARFDRIGDGICIQVYGGDRPHIGCAVHALPRPSLQDCRQTSATSCVLNVSGHKDEHICRFIAEEVAKRENAVTVCTGGFHIDGMTQGQIGELMECLPAVAKDLSDCPLKVECINSEGRLGRNGD